MGPLIPNDILSSEWSSLVAVLIGMAFGYVLEASGLSSSRKMAGVFYGYDWTVLRVFFTAAIVAMIGLLYMDYVQIVDMGKLYIQPTFLTAAIVGGIIMGLGFITGGFCPGTCLTAVAIGKIDGLIFFIGILIGVVIFSEAYPLIEQLYTGNSLGHVTLKESLGIPHKWTVVGFTVIGIIAFYATTWIGRRVRKVEY